MFTRTFTRYHAFRIRLERHVPRTRAEAALWEAFLFVFKQAYACLFGICILALILLTHLWWPKQFFLERYDFLFLAALTIQICFLVFRLETVREAKVILMFHVIGTIMELFKTSVGSWNYPEHCLIRIGHVPLFSGFMYASVGSYLVRVARIVDMRYSRFLPQWCTVLLAAFIYLNFFTHHFLPDIRIVLFVAVAAAFGPTMVYFTVYRVHRRMPLLLGFLLVTFCIWLAENVGTFGQIWLYPDQHTAWHMVHWAKFGSWFLLMIISFILVSFAHPPQRPEGYSDSAREIFSP